MSETQAISVLILLLSNLGALVGFFIKLNNRLIILETKFDLKVSQDEKEKKIIADDLNNIGKIFREQIKQKNFIEQKEIEK